MTHPSNFPQPHMDSKTLNQKIGVIGLGYVGLPLALALSEIYHTVGFDINTKKISDLQRGIDTNKEVPNSNFKLAKHLTLTADATNEKLADCSVYIVTVPTPIDKHNTPNLFFLEAASELVGKLLALDNMVIYESTVYPGCTEEVCVPILEKVSGLTHNKDFWTGYSPERINPGDKIHTLKTIVKVVSGSTEQTTNRVEALYSSIVSAGVKRASSIKVAEAAKVIENTQRDINIAFINELAIIFAKLNINTSEVLEVASSKWNFLSFKPGLVGGHCIGVDPYYLAYKAKRIGIHPEMILAGRRINDGMAHYIASHFVKLLLKKKQASIKDANVLVLGITFKENCSDVRNSKVVDLVQELIDYNFRVDVFDPVADATKVKECYHIDMLTEAQLKQKSGTYDGVLYCVHHDVFDAQQVGQFKKADGILYAVKGGLPTQQCDYQL